MNGISTQGLNVEKGATHFENKGNSLVIRTLLGHFTYKVENDHYTIKSLEKIMVIEEKQ